MRYRQTTRRIPALALALLATPALAQEPVGNVTGTLDGAPISCRFQPDQSHFLGFGTSRTVSILTSRCEGVAGQIALGFEQTGDSIDLVEISLRGFDTSHLFGNSDTGAMLALHSASEGGDVLSLSGTLSARLGTSDDHGRTIDHSAARLLEVSFDGVIAPLQN